MKKNNGCCSTPAMGAVLERPRYYPRQLITPEILTLGDDYLRHKQRLHNRLLHGWGVVCGLVVAPAPTADLQGYEPWKVVVRAGYALGPFGDGILVERDSVVDLRTTVAGCGDPCGKPAADPWCGDVYVERQDGIYYIAIKYAEKMVRPERVQPAGCGCEDTRCESSRWKDCYEIGVLCDCPHGDEEPPAPDLNALIKGAMADCPECPTDPWVGLASVEVNADGSIKNINNCGCRRIVVSFANFWWRCAPDHLDVHRAEPTKDVDAGADAEITVAADGVKPNARVTIARDVKVLEWKQVGDKIVMKVRVDPKATAGPRRIVILNPDSTLATVDDALEVKAAPGAPPARRMGRRAGPHH